MQVIRFRGLSLVVADEQMERTTRLAEKAARSCSPVLLCGESGTGKELFARFIHEKSISSRGPYISINCAAIPEGLMESELFGFEKGAFTGAINLKIGKFEQANHGTLLLDEISEMSVNLQAKLLRVLQEGEVDRLGGRGTTKVSARIIATTNKNPLQLIKDNLFREDLFFRLNVIRIDCDPLRGRSRAITELAREFVRESSKNQARSQLAIADSAMAKLTAYHWPGNVRELQNTIERAVLLTDGQEITEEQLHLTGLLVSKDLEDSSCQTLARVEKEHILRVLQYSHGNRAETARMLGITTRTLRNKLKEYQAG